jgi:hypothetical protein
MFVAPMDGTEVAYSGSPLITSVSVEKMANHRVRILSKHEGTVVGITKVHVMPTGNMMKVVEESPLNGNSISFTADRQYSIVHDTANAGGADISDSCRLGDCGARR